MLIHKVRKGTEAATGEEPWRLRKGRGCADQIFVVRHLCEKFLARGKEVYFAFMDLEKVYDNNTNSKTRLNKFCATAVQID